MHKISFSAMSVCVSPVQLQTKCINVFDFSSACSKKHRHGTAEHARSEVRLSLRWHSSDGALTWHGEVLSVYDVILEQLVVLLGVTVEVLQVRHHRHAPPPVARVCAGRDGHRRLRGGVFLTHPAKQEEEMTRETNRDGPRLKQGYYKTI